MRFLDRFRNLFSRKKEARSRLIRQLGAIDTDSIGGGFHLPPEIGRKFNAYAEAAMPNEIGGLLRIRNIDGVFTVVDLAILEQKASPVYFEFVDEAQAKFVMDLALNGRGDEISEWCGLIHSHPHMDPLMSGTDIKNLRLIAGTNQGFSVICSAWENPDRNYFALNYACHGQPSLMLDNMSIPSENLSGVETTEDEQRLIEEEVAEKVGHLSSYQKTTGEEVSTFNLYTYLGNEWNQVEGEWDEPEPFEFTSPERLIDITRLLSETEMEITENAFMVKSAQPENWFLFDHENMDAEETDDVITAVAEMESHDEEHEILLRSSLRKLSCAIDRLLA